jgi:hypothetical protein
MTFSEYAQMLYPVIGGGVKTSEFVLALVNNVMEVPTSDIDKENDANDKYNPLASLVVSTLEKIFSGKRKMSEKKAQAILAHLDNGRFKSYIAGFTVDTMLELGGTLRNNGIQVSENTDAIAEKCSELFADIIRETAYGSSALVPAQLTFFDSYRELVPDFSATVKNLTETEAYLLMEAKGICPSCGAKLVNKKSNTALPEFVVVQIVPPTANRTADKTLPVLADLAIGISDYDALDNKILLCVSCANKYVAHTSRDECTALIDTKGKLVRLYAASLAMEKIALEDEIEQVLRRIASATEFDLSIKLNYDVLRLKDKIPATNVPLLIKAKGYVVEYYRFIESIFSDLEREGKLFSRVFASGVKHGFEVLNAKGLTHDEIYAQLVDWFQNQSGTRNNVACEIIVAFFVQNCEVFNEIT